MNEEARYILLEILSIGICNIRFYANSNDVTYCSIESDHLHNIPACLSKNSVALLRYYYDIERVSYIKSMRDYTGQYDTLWERLRDVIAKM